MRKNAIRLTLTDKGIECDIKDKELAVLAVSDYVWGKIHENDMEALNVLHACVCHVVGRDLSGKLEEQFIENMKNSTPDIRKAYTDIKKELKQKQS